jgi:hypothetical protein
VIIARFIVTIKPREDRRISPLGLRGENLPLRPLKEI